MKRIAYYLFKVIFYITSITLSHICFISLL